MSEHMTTLVIFGISVVAGFIVGRVWAMRTLFE